MGSTVEEEEEVGAQSALDVLHLEQASMKCILPDHCIVLQDLLAPY